MASDPHEEIKRSPEEVRQGSSRPRVTYVLVAAVILVIVAFVVVGALIKR